MAKILIVAPGAYGDAFPLFAIADALRARSHQVTVVCDKINLKLVQHLQLPFIEFGSFPGDVYKHEKTGLLTEILSIISASRIRHQIDFLQPLIQKFDLIIGNQLATGAAMVAKAGNIPWVFCAASPLAIPSRESPPLLPYFEYWQRLFSSPKFSRFCLDQQKAISKLLMRSTCQQQEKLGLSRRLHPLFEGRYSADLNLLMVSPRLLEPAADWPTNTHVSGFTWFTPDHMRSTSKLAVLDKFLGTGEPPVVFTLGGPRRSSPGDFFNQGIAACEALGKRAIVVAAQSLHEKITPTRNALLTAYLPFQDVFPDALATVHSGGIGTIGLGMRYALPALLCPTGVDQHDNARRAQAMGFAHVLESRRHTARQLATALDSLLNDQSCKQRLQACAKQLATEDGAKNAADLIEKTFNV